MCRSLPHIRGQVSCSLLDGQHHDGDDDGDTDAGQNPQCTGPDELVWVLTQDMKRPCVRLCKDVAVRMKVVTHWQVSMDLH